MTRCPSLAVFGLITCGLLPIAVAQGVTAPAEGVTAAEVDLAIGKARVLIEDGNSWGAVPVLYRVVEKYAPDRYGAYTPERKAVADRMHQARWLLADALVEHGHEQLAICLFEQEDSWWRRDSSAAVDSTTNRRGDLMARLPADAMRYWFKRHSPGVVGAATVSERHRWVILESGSKSPQWLPHLSESSPVAQQARLGVAKTLIWRGIGLGSGVDDFSRSTEVVTYTPEMVEEGLAILAAGKWTAPHLDDVARLTAFGYAYLERPRDGAAVIDALAVAGDAGGILRFRAALLRGLPRCAGSACAELPSQRHLAALAELVYRRFCAGERTGLIAAGLADVSALRQELREALSDGSGDARVRKDRLADDWPSGATWLTRKTVRRLAASSAVEMTRSYLWELREAARELERLPATKLSSPTGVALTAAYVRAVAMAEQELDRRIGDQLKVTRRLLHKLAVQHDQAVKYDLIPGIKAVELELDEAVCVDYVVPQAPALPPPPHKSRGCAGCGAGGGQSPGAWIALLIIGFVIGMRRRAGAGVACYSRRPSSSSTTR